MTNWMYSRQRDGRSHINRMRQQYDKVLAASYIRPRSEILNKDFNPPRPGDSVRVLDTGEIVTITDWLPRYDLTTPTALYEVDSEAYGVLALHQIESVTRRFKRQGAMPALNGHNRTKPAKSRDKRRRRLKPLPAVLREKIEALPALIERHGVKPIHRNSRPQPKAHTIPRKHDDMERVGEPIPLHMRADLKRPPVRLQLLPDVLQRLLEAA